MKILKKILNLPKYLSIRLDDKLFALKLWHYGIEKKRYYVCGGMPIIEIKENGHFTFGDGLTMVNNQKFSTLGRITKCKLLVYSDANLTLGNNVAMSNTTIVATKEISIGNRVMIGGGVTIVDSDFHSMNADNWFTLKDETEMISLPVKIGNNVFIGMDSIILKGVSIGNNVRIAAASVVTQSIPDNQIWGGNPAKFIKEIQ
jgi:acetyltransferase-like isoleucine patch superfamily enzyme